MVKRRRSIFVPILLALSVGCGRGDPAPAVVPGEGVPPSPENRAFVEEYIKALSSTDYWTLKSRIVKEFQSAAPGRFGAFVPGVYREIDTREKVMALTFDACGGKSRGYNKALIQYLRETRTPATLFVTGLWIDENPAVFQDLAGDPLFLIGNHGLLHRLCGVAGETKYGVLGTKNVGEVVDEMELNARKIERITGTRPRFFRSATAYTDETAAKIATMLGMEVVNYDVLSGDAIPDTPAAVIRDNILNNARPGAIVIMHFNHPKWHEVEALREALPALKKKGYSFVQLDDVRLKPVKARGGK
jgi:peptidoglycan/xylan/chitin deacetylase (PgdA/CDA1 family)